jgi:hypothetical protein
MRRAIPIALLACLAFVAPARAQDTEPSYAPAIEAHRDGRWSMQFEIGDNFQLQSFEGAGLAVTKNTSPSGAWRFGVSLNGSFVNGETTNSFADDSTTIAFTDKVPSVDTGAFGLDLLRLVRYQPDRRISLQLGFGPTVRFFRQNTHIPDDRAPGSLEREERYSLSSYGGLGQLGVEVFVARAVSLHAHYGAFAGYEQRTAYLKETSSDAGATSELIVDAGQHRWTITSEGVTMGISLYL